MSQISPQCLIIFFQGQAGARLDSLGRKEQLNQYLIEVPRADAAARLRNPTVSSTSLAFLACRTRIVNSPLRGIDY
jgi:hypothetical protein